MRVLLNEIIKHKSKMLPVNKHFNTWLGVTKDYEIIISTPLSHGNYRKHEQSELMISFKLEPIPKVKNLCQSPLFLFSSLLEMEPRVSYRLSTL